MPKKVIIFFSEAIDSPIFKNLILRLSEESLETKFVFIGTETEPLFNYTLNLRQDALFLGGSAKKKIAPHLFRLLNLVIRTKPSKILAFGQTATIFSILSSMAVPNITRIYFRGHTSMNKVEKFWRGRIYDLFSNKFSHSIIVANENTREYLITDEKVPHRKVQVIPFGFELDSFSKASEYEVAQFKVSQNIDSSKFLIGIVSRNSIVKGLDYSLTAVSKFLTKHSDSTLLLAGVGDIRNTPIERITNSINPEQIRIIARTSDIETLFKSLDVFIHTPINPVVESYGLVYVEAFAAGVASIITLSGIASELALDGINCHVVDYESEQQVFSAIEKMYEDSEFRKSLGSNAKVAVSRLTIRGMCDGYVNMLNSDVR